MFSDNESKPVDEAKHIAKVESVVSLLDSILEESGDFDLLVDLISKEVKGALLGSLRYLGPLDKIETK